MSTDRRASGWMSAFCGAVGLTLSFLWSWRPSLWTDESATISASTRSWPELWAMVHNIDAVHGAYYSFMHVWLSIFPASAVSMRLPSALAVGLTAGLLHRLILLLAPARYAVVGALVFAVLPRTTWMGLEARSSALSTALAVLATWLLVRYMRSGRRGLLIPYVLVIAAGTATHIYVALLVGAHGISVLASQVRWRDRWWWLGSGVLGVSAAVPVIVISSRQTGQLGGGQLQLSRLARNVVVNQWFLGETATLSQGADSSLTLGQDSWWKLAALAVALLGWGLVLVGLRALIRKSARTEPVSAMARWWGPWLVVPSALVGAYSLVGDNLYNPRYFAFSTPALAMAITVGLLAVTAKRIRAALVCALILLIVPVYVSQRGTYAKSSSDWSHVAARVAEVKRGGDGIYFAPRYPITGTTVGQTTRGIQTAYPAAFAGMVDITLLRSPVQDDNLTGTSRLLGDSLSELQDVDRVVVVRRIDYAYAAIDEATLTSSGFTSVGSWQGPLDQVITFERT